MNHAFENAAKFEHRFWLQILGDHSRFIYDSLAPVEKEDIRMASEFIQIFDTLLSQVNSADVSQLTIMAENETLKLRGFKLNLMKKHLLGKIKMHLSPTFTNHMVNELEEHLRVLKYFKSNQIPPVYHE